MRATFISRQATDLTAVNAARASMGKVRTVFDNSDKKGSDKNLLAYLNRENHFTPFTHQRETGRIAALIEREVYRNTGIAL